MTTWAVVIADTHITLDPARLPRTIWDAVTASDLVLHAGDVITAPLLDALEAEKPVHCVLGNNDYTLTRRLPDTVTIDIEGVAVTLIHDAGPTQGRAARMQRRFPAADLVIHGHTHWPEKVVGPAGQVLFNPGSPTHRRRAPTHSFGMLEISDGTILRLDILEC
jgi:hypothetical protein